MSRIRAGSTVLAERSGAGTWRIVSYRDARRRVRRLGARLLRLNLKPGNPLAILSDNAIDHALMMLAAMHIGIPSVSVSSSYSLASSDHAKLRSILAPMQPELVYEEDREAYARALSAVASVCDAPVVTSRAERASDGTLLQQLECDDDAAVSAAFDAITPDTIAKLLFISGSTGEHSVPRDASSAVYLRQTPDALLRTPFPGSLTTMIF